MIVLINELYYTWYYYLFGLFKINYFILNKPISIFFFKLIWKLKKLVLIHKLI